MQPNCSEALSFRQAELLKLLQSSSWENEFCEAIADNIQGDIVVFFDGHNYWEGSKVPSKQCLEQYGIDLIPVSVRPGGKRDALLYSLGIEANPISFPYSQKIRILVLLHDVEWGQWSDKEIAVYCGASQTLVSTLRQTIQSGK